jgi:hypothetical protein
VIAFNRDYRNSRLFQFQQDLLRLAKMRRFYLRPVEQVAGDEEDVGFFFNRFGCDESKRVGEIFVRESAIKATAAEMDISDVDDFHGRV